MLPMSQAPHPARCGLQVSTLPTLQVSTFPTLQVHSFPQSHHFAETYYCGWHIFALDPDKLCSIWLQEKHRESASIELELNTCSILCLMVPRLSPPYPTCCLEYLYKAPHGPCQSPSLIPGQAGQLCLHVSVSQVAICILAGFGISTS